MQKKSPAICPSLDENNLTNALPKKQTNLKQRMKYIARKCLVGIVLMYGCGTAFSTIPMLITRTQNTLLGITSDEKTFNQVLVESNGKKSIKQLNTRVDLTENEVLMNHEKWGGDSTRIRMEIARKYSNAKYKMIKAYPQKDEPKTLQFSKQEPNEGFGKGAEDFWGILRSYSIQGTNLLFTDKSLPNVWKHENKSLPVKDKMLFDPSDPHIVVGGKRFSLPFSLEMVNTPMFFTEMTASKLGGDGKPYKVLRSFWRNINAFTNIYSQYEVARNSKCILVPSKDLCNFRFLFNKWWFYDPEDTVGEWRKNSSRCLSKGGVVCNLGEQELKNRLAQQVIDKELYESYQEFETEGNFSIVFDPILMEKVVNMVISDPIYTVTDAGMYINNISIGLNANDVLVVPAKMTIDDYEEYYTRPSPPAREFFGILIVSMLLVFSAYIGVEGQSIFELFSIVLESPLMYILLWLFEISSLRGIDNFYLHEILSTRNGKPFKRWILSTFNYTSRQRVITKGMIGLFQGILTIIDGVADKRRSGCRYIIKKYIGSLRSSIFFAISIINHSIGLTMHSYSSDDMEIHDIISEYNVHAMYNVFIDLIAILFVSFLVSDKSDYLLSIQDDYQCYWWVPFVPEFRGFKRFTQGRDTYIAISPRALSAFQFSHGYILPANLSNEYIYAVCDRSVIPIERCSTEHLDKISITKGRMILIGNLKSH